MMQYRQHHLAEGVPEARYNDGTDHPRAAECRTIPDRGEEMKRLIPVLALFVVGMFGVMWLARADEPCNPNGNLGKNERCVPEQKACGGKISAQQPMCIPGQSLVANPMVLKCYGGQDTFNGVCASGNLICTIHAYPIIDTIYIDQDVCEIWTVCVPDATTKICGVSGNLDPIPRIKYFNECCVGAVAIPNPILPQ